MGALRNHPAGKSLTVAVAGQPNTGKSTLFNRLTGLNQRVGNWTGKTVDRKEGAAFGMAWPLPSWICPAATG